jgi:hypothetical protein
VAARKKDPALLRTIDLFTRKTPLEEAQDILEDEKPSARSADPGDMVEQAEATAIRWLGLDAFHEGDDVKVAVHPKGHAVIVLVSTTAKEGVPYGTSTLKLSRVQWTKLKALARDG